MAALSALANDKNMAYTTHHGAPGLYKLETGWQTPPGTDGGMSRNHSISSGLALLGVEEQHDAAAGGDMYGTGMPWTPQTDMSSAQYGESPLAAPMPNHTRSQSYDLSMSAAVSWADPTAADMYAYGQGQMPTPASVTSSYFPSPSATPHMRPSASRHKSASTSSSGSHSSCICFTTCLQSLQAFHNASSPASTPFDQVLMMNKKAVAGCASMLECPRCMSRSGTHTAAMLLGTVIGKITSFYNSASQSHFKGSMANASPTANGLGVSLGAFPLNVEDGRWLEVGILTRELRKLEGVYARFRDVCPELSDDPKITKAMIDYLDQNLNSLLEIVNHLQGDMTYS